MKRPTPPSRRGSALVIAMCAVAVVATLAMGFLLMLTTIGRSHASGLDRAEAFYLADAGLAEAYAGLAIGKTGNVGSAQAPALFGNGLFWTEAEEVGERRVQVTSTGMCGSQRVTLSFVAEKTLVGAATLGVFASQDLVVQSGSLIDGYDSRSGTYAEHVARGLDATKAGKVTGNGNIALLGGADDPTLVNGDASPGPQGALEQDAYAEVTGEVVAAGAPVQPPPVDPPRVPMLPALVVPSSAPAVVLSPGDYGFEGVLLEEGARLEVSGPARIVVGDAELRHGATLAFDTSGGRVDVYVTGALTVARGAQVGEGNEDPTRASVQVAGAGAVAWDTSEPFHGVLYAPESELTTGPGAEVFGSLIAERLELGRGAQLHFDRALVSLAASEQGLPQMLAWRIVDLGPEGGSAGPSPFVALGVGKDDLTGPSRAHADQQLELRYEDLDGVVQVYSGMESGFDWSQVSAVLSIARDGERVVRGTAGSDEPPAIDYSPEDQALIDLFASLSGGTLKDALLAESPLSADVLAYMAALTKADLPMSGGDLTKVLEGNTPMPDASLLAVVKAVLANADPEMSGADCKNLLLDHSPLSGAGADDVLTAMLASDGGVMSSGEMTDVLLANSPLSAGLLDLVTGGLTSLKLTDVTKVLLAQ